MKRKSLRLIDSSPLLSGVLGITATVITSFSLLYPTVAQNVLTEIKIVAGDESGEYYAAAKDIEKLAQENNLDIDIIATKGALQNIDDVFRYNSVSLGLTQSDILAFYNTFANDNEEIRRKAESLRIVLPLYEEEVHLITRKDIKSVEDLEGKIVSIGDENSGTSTTAATLLFQWGVNPQELLTYDVKRSIDALRNGEIDGMFYVVGVPAKVLTEQILKEDNFQILPISLAINEDDDFFSRLYSPVTLPADTYEWQSEEVQTLAVQSLLFTVENDGCEQVSPVASLIKDNLSWLQANGSPIWKKVDLKLFHDETPERMSQCVSQ